MIALRHLCRSAALNASVLSPSLGYRCFSISRLGARNWTKPKEYGQRCMSTQQTTATQERPLNDIEHVPNTEKNDNGEMATTREHPADWFENRYLDKSYHARDGLDPDEWLLLYRIADEQQRNRIEYSLYAVALGAIVCGTVMFVVTCIRRDDNPFRIAPGFLLVGFMGIMYATRLRRYGVIRLYAKRHEQEEWERWRFEQLLLPPAQRDVKAPMRHYRIIWSDLLHRHHMFAYNSRQISDWVHRKSWLARAMNGNFLVLGRPWAVHPEFFDEPPDYIFVRRAS